MTEPDIFFGTVHTSHGVFQIAATDRGVAKIYFPAQRAHARLARRIPRRTQRILRAAKSFLKTYFAGRPRGRKSVPVDWNGITGFDRIVLKELKQVRSGQVISYGELAERCRKPQAARAVGNALRRNPIPILIPCHRVVRRDASIGGYRSGSRWKKRLLALEGR